MVQKNNKWNLSKEKGEELQKGKKFYSMIKGEKFLVQEYKFKNEVFYTIVG